MERMEGMKRMHGEGQGSRSYKGERGRGRGGRNVRRNEGSKRTHAWSRRGKREL